MLTSKNVVILGTFDVLDDKYKKLIHKARKLAYEGKVTAFIYDDFVSDQVNKKFPIQEAKTRTKNISYFIDEIVSVVDLNKISNQLQDFIDKSDLPVSLVHYIEDGKDFIGRDVFKKNGCLVKFCYLNKI